MTCNYIDISYAGSDFKLTYSGTSLGEIFSSANFPFYQKGYLAQSAQKIADHIWLALRNNLELGHTVYVKVTETVHANGSLFVKLEIFIQGTSKNFNRQNNHIFIKRESPLGEDTLPWLIRKNSCVTPEDYQARSPRFLPKPTLGFDTK